MGSRAAESSMLAEIRERGELLARLLPRLHAETEKKLAGAAQEDLHLVGCGDMYFAAAQVEALAKLLWELPVRAWRSMDRPSWPSWSWSWCWPLELPALDPLDAILGQVVALQMLVAQGVSAMGRDPDRWLGGRRSEQIQAMSQQRIRGSQLWTPKR